MLHLAASHRLGCRVGGLSCMSAQSYNSLARKKLTLLRKEGEIPMLVFPECFEPGFLVRIHIEL